MHSSRSSPYALSSLSMRRVCMSRFMRSVLACSKRIWCRNPTFQAERHCPWNYRSAAFMCLLSHLSGLQPGKCKYEHLMQEFSTLVAGAVHTCSILCRSSASCSSAFCSSSGVQGTVGAAGREEGCRSPGGTLRLVLRAVCSNFCMCFPMSACRVLKRCAEPCTACVKALVIANWTVQVD